MGFDNFRTGNRARSQSALRVPNPKPIPVEGLGPDVFMQKYSFSLPYEIAQ